MHSIFGERERANWGRVSTPTCAASLVSAASQSREAPPPQRIFSYLKPTFRISVLTSVGCFGGSRPTGPVLEKERCVELCCAASITNNRTTELRTRGVLCCFYEISHLCAYLESVSRKTLRYGGVQRPLYIIGERERANLVVSTADFSLYIYIYI